MTDNLKAYTFKIIDGKELSIYFKNKRQEYFTNEVDIDTQSFYSEVELEKQQMLHERMGKLYRLNIGIYHSNEMIGWSFGFQTNATTFYMCNTGIHPKHRNKGVYKALLPFILAILKEEGFQEVYSRHKVSNNAVIVPKLQTGFYISKMEISRDFGILVHLSYYFNQNNNKALKYWTGQYRPDDSFKKYMKGIE